MPDAPPDLAEPVPRAPIPTSPVPGGGQHPRLRDEARPRPPPGEAPGTVKPALGDPPATGGHAGCRRLRPCRQSAGRWGGTGTGRSPPARSRRATPARISGRARSSSSFGARRLVEPAHRSTIARRNPRLPLATIANTPYQDGPGRREAAPRVRNPLRVQLRDVERPGNDRVHPQPSPMAEPSRGPRRRPHRTTRWHRQPWREPTSRRSVRPDRTGRTSRTRGVRRITPRRTRPSHPSTRCRPPRSPTCRPTAGRAGRRAALPESSRRCAPRSPR